MTHDDVTGKAEVRPPELTALPADRLISTCDCAALPFSDTGELQPRETALGQERVLEAVEFATGIEHAGYNLYVMGSPGVGKHRLINELLSSRVRSHAAPSDWCYVANFDDPDAPNAIELPPGQGARLRADMQQLVEDLLTALPAAFQSDEYRRRAQEITDEFKRREDEAAEEMGKNAAARGIALLHTPTGYSLAPQKDGKILNATEFEALDDAEKAGFQQAMGEIKDELRSVLGHVPLWQREMRQRFRELDADVTELTVSQLMLDLQHQYRGLPEVLDYLNAVGADVVENAALFRVQGSDEGLDADDPRFLRYRVNLLVGNDDGGGAPVVFEANPNYQNLVGRIEHVAHMGTLTTNFTLIKAGALHRANGGFLVLDADKLLLQPFAWDAVKRALGGEEIRIESVERVVGVMSTTSLEPEPIPLDLKVVLIGDRRLYYLLKAYDPEYGPLFKVVADFNEDMPRLDGQEMAYARLVATLQQGEALRPVSRDGVARIIDWSARRAGDGEKLSLHLGSLTDLMKEADHFAEVDQSPQVQAGHVQTAIDAQMRRSDQLRKRLHEAILDDTVLIDTDGRQLGQVNGLVFIRAGDQAFGSPTRISATARMGAGTVIDIETEAKLGGAIHSKGVMILSAYLAARYARHQPLSVSASLVFEQSYGDIEGDSASLGELCALLSAIGDLSIDQSLAVTGSVNQHGQVQAIGGVNEKIEGFYDICAARGLTGRQGVIIPAANTDDLMLREDLRDAASQGRFAVYPVDHADQVIARLTGMSAGSPDENGLYPSDSCNGRVQLRLFEWTAARQQYVGSAGNGG
ncbi:MAG: AAA family ATPase [Gammaproteobacteria bacterium]|nr:AAA family ATPase [Gammaproteobacteria bacterium]